MSDLFYETQLQNEELTWRLYAYNIRKYSDEKDNRRLLDVGILQDNEVHVHINHKFPSNSMDPLGLGEKLKGMYDNAKSLSPFVSATVGNSSVLKTTSNKMVELIGSVLGEGAGSAAGSIANIANDFITSGYNNLSTYLYEKIKTDGNSLLGSQFVSAFDMIKTFQGSNVSFSIPKLQSNWIYGLSPNGFDKSIKARYKLLLDDIIGDVKEFAGVYGLQTPPNEYIPEFTGLDKEPNYTGTYQLEIGKQYTIKNLLLVDFDFDASALKAMGSGGEPLYATATYVLEPAAFITKDQLKKIMGI